MKSEGLRPTQIYQPAREKKIRIVNNLEKEKKKSYVSVFVWLFTNYSGVSYQNLMKVVKLILRKSKWVLILRQLRKKKKIERLNKLEGGGASKGKKTWNLYKSFHSFKL